jgi:signal transduction histidine kinase
MDNKNPVKTDRFESESRELAMDRVRLGCLAIAIIKPLFLPVFYLNAHDKFPTILALYILIVVICAALYYLTYKNISPYLLAGSLVILTYSLVISSILITGLSRSPFFPLLLMCVTGVGLIAAWNIRQSFIIFGLILGFYCGGILLLDKEIDWRIFSINLTAVLDASLVGSVGIFLLEQVRLKEYRKRISAYRDRENMGRMLHDCLGADMYNIKLLCELTDHLPIDNQEIKQNIARIYETAKKGMDDIRDFLAFEDSVSLPLKGLINRMHDYGYAVFPCYGIEFKLTEIISDQSCAMLPLHACNLYLMYKEALTNITKHAKANAVAISIADEGNILHLTIRDNGTGFCPDSQVSGCRGLSNIKNRIEDIDGTVKIQSQKGQGTEIHISIPMNYD